MIARDPQDLAAAAVTDAAVAVAHAASTLLEDAEVDAYDRAVVNLEDLAELRLRVTAWREAGEAFLRSLPGGDR